MSKKTSATSIAIASVLGVGLLTGIWALNNIPAVGDLLTDPEGAKVALKGWNLEPKEVGGYAAIGCGRAGIFSTKFTATNLKGEQVSGAVCKSLLGTQTLVVN